MNLLHVDSSILGPNSVSRGLTAAIVAQEVKLHPGITVTYRDLAADAPPHLSPTHIAAWHGATPEDEAVLADLATGGVILDELFAADIVVVGAPMYNFAIPSQLKAWIDRLVIAGKSFHYSAEGKPESLLPKGKKLIIASSRGGAYAPPSPAAFLDHQESYLRGVFGFLGFADVTIIRAEGVATGAEAKAVALDAAHKQIAALAA
jgi:FMN-dependent NADH-azoreductase